MANRRALLIDECVDANLATLLHESGHDVGDRLPR
jgi:hypothetical protein